jgi:predicted Zn finger-like uncharacterized protein
VPEEPVPDAGPVRRRGEYEPVRSDLECTECHRVFVVVLDLGIDGNHRVRCPYCRHLHWRLVKDGHVTDVRWTVADGQQTVDAEEIIKLGGVTAEVTEASPVSTFLHQLWVDRFTR